MTFTSSLFFIKFNKKYLEYSFFCIIFANVNEIVL